ncbi:hypothetical protein OVN18_04355 [Microcella daejeonensis]|uniref:Uncharacterized protein n=1 Tax=Microcella daejeonensis TaxID=2994971 RepID=A0A9E8MNJ5_9MICO|nr:hypothetical protein [Microcella daejeonensis]WAB82247.1 hypothetical protein OVN18_04355 [Microcella daejeonensis]
MTDPQAGLTPPQNPYAAAAPAGGLQDNPYAATRPVRPPLTPRARTGAFIAGAVTMVMVSIGGTLIAVPLLLLVIGSIVAAVASSFGGELAGALESIERVAPVGLIIGIGIGVVLLGVVLVVAALFISRGILRARGLERAWPITWAGLGIAAVGGWIASGLLSIPVQLSGPILAGAGGRGSGEIEAVLGIVSSLAGVAVTAVIGAMSWWWMAHVMRPAGAVPAGAAPAGEPAAPAAPGAPAA